MLDNLMKNSTTKGEVDFDNVYPAVIECFVIIFLGYIAGRLNWISKTDSSGLNTFVSTFSLPSLIFLSLATLEFSSINWKFLLSIFVAKFVVFFAVGTITLLVNRPLNYGKAGLFAIFCTQSNDFALGYPIVDALYRNTHKDFSSYLYLVAPISLVILNPIGFILMEIEKRYHVPEEERQQGICMILTILKGVFLNPIVLMSIAGILGNIIFQHSLPAMLEGILKVLGAAFSATALFSLGIHMVGKVANLKGKGLVTPGILIAVKILILPIIIRESVSMSNPGPTLNDTVDFSMFGFLYGTFPSAPSVFVFAAQYALDVDLIATAMVACTFLSAPIMFVSAKMITLEVSAKYLPQMDKFLFNISIISLICCIWVAGIFIASKRWKQIPHFLTFCLVISQFTACVGAILWTSLPDGDGWRQNLQFVLFTVGVYSCRVWTMLLAIALFLLHWRSLCYVLRMRPLFVIIGWGFPLLAVGLLWLLGTRVVESTSKIDPNFQYGRIQAVVSCILMLVSLIVTKLCLIMQQRIMKRRSEYQSLLHDDDNTVTDQTTNYFDNDTTSDSHRPDADSCDRCSFTQSFVSCQGDMCKARRDKSSSCCLQDVEDIEVPTTSSISTKRDRRVSFNDKMCSNRFPCSSTQRQVCSTLLSDYQVTELMYGVDGVQTSLDGTDKHQPLRHTILLLILWLSMLVGFALCIWRLVLDEPSGIYVELEFLDCVLNFGQGFFIFTIFGLDVQLVVLPIVRSWQRFWLRVTNSSSQSINADAESIHIREQFIKYHYDKCVNDLVRDRRCRTKSYTSVFCGNEFVDWLMVVGLARDRTEAIKYGQHLLRSRVMQHTEDDQLFQDSTQFYQFSTLDSSTQLSINGDLTTSK